MLARILLVSLAAASVARAQLGNLGLSSTCVSAASSLVTSDFASCAAFGSIISVFTASGSIVEPVDNWLASLCSSSSNCTDATLANATSAIQNGCADEIASNNAIVSAVVTLVSNFTDVKESLCLASTSNSTFCVTNLMTDIQNATGTDLTISTFSNLNASTFTSLPSSTVCTDCSHALVSSLSPIFGANESDTVTGAIASVCGDSFTDGQIPSTVGEKTSSSNSSSGGSVESTPLNAAGSLDVGFLKIAGGAVVGVLGLAVLA